MLTNRILGRLGRYGVFGLLAGWLVTSTSLAAENYQTLPVQELSRTDRSLASEFNRGKIPTSAEAQAALRKQMILLVSKLTQPNEILNYSRHRKDISLMLSERNQPSEARATVVTTLLQFAGGVATRDTFSPASRINCVSILAELDEATENSRERRPPMPARAAYAPLFSLASNASTPAYMRAVALHGLERHARVYWLTSVWDDARHAEVTKLCLDLITSQPKTALDQKSHAWLARRAYDLLAVGKSNAAVDAALADLANPATLPSVRLSATGYLSTLDAATLTPEQAALHLVGTSHLVRSQLVHWYEYEDDKIKRDSNATAAGYGGMMGGMGGYGGMMGGIGGEGGYGGEGEGGEMGGYGGMGRGGMGGYGGEGGYGGGAADAPKPIDTQDWQTRASRRLLNQLTQTIHIALDGRPLADSQPVVAAPLNTAADDSVKAKAIELVTLIDNLQKAINDPAKVTDVKSLLSQAQVPIEEIMDFAKEVPGFAARYPELADEQELEDVPDEPAPAAAGGAAGGAAGPQAGGAPASGGEPTTTPAGAAAEAGGAQ